MLALPEPSGHSWVAPSTRISTDSRAGDLAGREHDLGDGVDEVAAGEVEQRVADVHLDDPIVDADRVQLQGRRHRRPRTRTRARRGSDR